MSFLRQSRHIPPLIGRRSAFFMLSLLLAYLRTTRLCSAI